MKSRIGKMIKVLCSGKVGVRDKRPRFSDPLCREHNQPYGFSTCLIDRHCRKRLCGETMKQTTTKRFGVGKKEARRSDWSAGGRSE